MFFINCLIAFMQFASAVPKEAYFAVDVYFWAVCACPGNQTHDHCITSAMLEIIVHFNMLQVNGVNYMFALIRLWCLFQGVSSVR